MKRNYPITKWLAATLLAGGLSVSCSNRAEDDPEPRMSTIQLNAAMMPDVREEPVSAVEDNTFMVLFWKDDAHLASPTNTTTWPAPYLAAQAPQPISFYQRVVFDTRYPYPDRTSYLYATGYAPGEVLAPVAGQGYRKLRAAVDDKEKGRYDFLGCDSWHDVYKGSQDDPFSHDKNKLYFRHLAAKLVFFAERDRNTMENKQFVRNVRITGLYMSTDGGKEYTSMFTPDEFEWQKLESSDFTATYDKAIEAAQGENPGVNTQPTAGYRAVHTMSFAGDDPDFCLEKHASDRVPVYGMRIDSCYVSNEIIIKDGKVTVQKSENPIRLKMDISAEMSFSPDFQLPDDGSTTDNLTFTRRAWNGVELTAIYKVNAAGQVTADAEPVYEFKPGMEYRIYLCFYRTGVNLVAIEQPWNVGGVHYITIPGGDQQKGGQKETN